MRGSTLRRAASTAPPARSALLDWSAKQSRILTAASTYLLHYAPGTFSDDELPHHHLRRGDAHDAFREWRAAAAQQQQQQQRAQLPAWLTGAWNRRRFVGGGEESSDSTESCYNLQTANLFIDVRIPHRAAGFASHAQCASDLTDDELRLLVRQHAFAGYTRGGAEDAAVPMPPVGAEPAICTRHHLIDYNYVGTPRPRPNKWHAVPSAAAPAAAAVDAWLETSFASTPDGQPYYYEEWYRLAADAGAKPTRDSLALIAPQTSDCPAAMVIRIGNLFNYAVARPHEVTSALDRFGASPHDAVDKALAAGERSIAEGALSLQAGHGRITPGASEADERWVIDASLQPWRCGDCLDDVLGGHAEPLASAAREHLQWGRHRFDVWRQ